MARILGLDLGSYAVKAVVLEGSMRSLAVRGVASVSRAGGDAAESLRSAVRQVLSRESVPVDQVAVALPGPALATHLLSLPFVDVKRIEATIPFELEGQLPFDLTEAVFDYQLAAVRDKKSDLLVGVVRKDELRALLGALASVDVDPRVVTHPGIAYGALLLQAPTLFTPGTEPIAILDVGHERTTLAVGQVGVGLEFARTFSGGGQELTRALASEFEVPLEDAAKWKDEHAALGSHINGPDSERAAGAFIRGLQPVLRELRQSLKSYAARSRRGVAQLYLCGGTGQLPGLDEQLGQDLGIPAQVLRLGPDASGPRASAPEALQAYALALGAQASGPKAQRFNLRRGEFAFKGHFDYLRERVGRLALFAASLIALLVASGFVHNSLLAGRERKVDAALCDITSRVLGQCQKDFNVALSMLKGKESPAAAIPKLSALALLTEFTSRMPADAPVTFDQLDITLDRIAMRIETDSPKTIDKITSGLKTYRCFKEVREGKVEKSKDGQKVSLRLDIEVECPEESRPPAG